MNTLFNTLSALAFAVFILAAQALATGPSDHEAAQDTEQAKQEAIEQARIAFKVRKATEREAWKVCKSFYGNHAELLVLKDTREFVCRRLWGVK